MNILWIKEFSQTKINCDKSKSSQIKPLKLLRLLKLEVEEQIELMRLKT